MCGILGLVGRAVTPEAFGAALDILTHRGPDGAGVMPLTSPAGPATFGHRRLAILDLSEAGAQPMVSHDGRWTLTFNGEIYNFRVLREALEREGVRFRSQSDTEVLLEAYVRQGPALFAALEGMFALAIHDRDTGEVVLARDHLGIKPLYHHVADGVLTFASEVKAMLALGVPARLNRPLLGEYLAQLWVQEPDTLFEGVFKLPAAHWARFRGGRLEVHRYWEPTPAVVSDSPLEELAALLEAAVSSQLVADRPVGAYLSGGVDSSLITELARSQAAELLVVSARYAPGDLSAEGTADDGRWVDHFLATRPGLRHESLVLQADQLASYDRLVWHLDEPIADPAIVPAYLLAERARQAGAVVMLSGMGADELFGGYRRYGLIAAIERLRQVPGPLRGALGLVAGMLQRQRAGALRRLGVNVSRLQAAAGTPWPLGYLNMTGYFEGVEIDALVGPSWREPLRGKLGAAVGGAPASGLTAQQLDLPGYLASHNLMYMDKASMAASVEVRVPFLTPRLAGFALGLPEALRYANRQEKVLLKALCARVVDPAIAHRPKAGFAMPVRAWLSAMLTDEEVSRLLAGLEGWLPSGEVRRVVAEHRDGRADHTMKVWALLHLARWREAFLVAG
ncbi:MAG: asparagine synthase (glutamine-hydrolyzing) [Candidatus Sericytochromatia bacterium]|nr:asparagine synthase (glutamine-hydrolyzing) [Candidatus Sericytochromatia bacterium]